MAEVKWIKIVTDIFSNKKIKQIEAMPDADSILVVWFKLICLAGSVNAGGNIVLTRDIAYTDEMLATELRRPITTIRLALKTFETFQMIEIYNGTYQIANWDKYQNTGGLDKIREQTRQRVAKCRENKRLEQCNATSNATVTQGNAIERELDKEEEKEIYKEKEKGKDTAPDGAIHTQQLGDAPLIGVEDENKDIPFSNTNEDLGDTQNIGVDLKKSIEQTTAPTIEKKKGVEDEKKHRAKAVNKVSEATIIDYFATTWEKYPRQVNNIQALKTYKYKLVGMDSELARETANKIFGMLKWQIKEWAKEGEHGRDMDKIPHFSTWLNANFADADGKLRCR